MCVTTSQYSISEQNVQSYLEVQYNANTDKIKISVKCIAFENCWRNRNMGETGRPSHIKITEHVNGKAVHKPAKVEETWSIIKLRSSWCRTSAKVIHSSA